MTHLTHSIVKAKDEVIGVDVKNSADESLGEICEIMLDKATGKVVYAVLESGGFLGLNGKLFALPWTALHYDTNRDCFLINMTKDMLKAAPGFDKDHWPDMADRSFSDTVTDYYSTEKEKSFMEQNSKKYGPDAFFASGNLLT